MIFRKILSFNIDINIPQKPVLIIKVYGLQNNRVPGLKGFKGHQFILTLSVISSESHQLLCETEHGDNIPQDPIDLYITLLSRTQLLTRKEKCCKRWREVQKTPFPSLLQQKSLLSIFSFFFFYNFYFFCFFYIQTTVPPPSPPTFPTHSTERVGPLKGVNKAWHHFSFQSLLNTDTWGNETF